MEKLPRPLLIFALLYLAASFIHFAHNAEFLAEYPKLPDWLTRANVYLAWAATLLPGFIAFFAWARGHKMWAYGLLAVWGALSYLGLDHYYVAPLSAHTHIANLTILFEVLAGTLLLVSSVAYLIRLRVARLRVGN